MKRILIILILMTAMGLSFLMHIRDFPKDLMSLHAWRQTQTQSTINNFYEEDMNILNPRRNDRGNSDGIFRMEFPLMQWMVAVLYKIFGNHLIITRIFMFITGILSILGMYRFLLAFFRDRRIAVTAAWAFSFSPAFFYHSVNPMPDNFALCCSLWGLALFFGWYNSRRFIDLFFSMFFTGLGALVKLPFILYFIVPLTWWVMEFRKKPGRKELLRMIIPVLVFLLLPMVWYITVVHGWKGNPVVKGMFDENVKFLKTLDYYQHNLVSNLPELMLNYGSLPFFISGFWFFSGGRATGMLGSQWSWHLGSFCWYIISLKPMPSQKFTTIIFSLFIRCYS